MYQDPQLTTIAARLTCLNCLKSLNYFGIFERIFWLFSKAKLSKFSILDHFFLCQFNWRELFFHKIQEVPTYLLIGTLCMYNTQKKGAKDYYVLAESI